MWSHRSSASVSWGVLDPSAPPPGNTLLTYRWPLGWGGPSGGDRCWWGHACCPRIHAQRACRRSGCWVPGCSPGRTASRRDTCRSPVGSKVVEGRKGKVLACGNGKRRKAYRKIKEENREKNGWTGGKNGEKRKGASRERRREISERRKKERKKVYDQQATDWKRKRKKVWW